MRSTALGCACLLALGAHAHAGPERVLVSGTATSIDIADEVNAVTLLVRTALGAPSPSGLTVAKAPGTADRAIVLELAHEGTGLALTSTIVDRSGVVGATIVHAGDGDVMTLATGVVAQVVATTHAKVQALPASGLGQLRPYAEAMRLGAETADAIDALGDADPQTARAVTAIRAELEHLATAAPTPEVRATLARLLGSEPAEPETWSALRAAPDDARLDQLLAAALADPKQRRAALAFAASLEPARLTHARHEMLIGLAATARASGSQGVAARIGLHAASAGVDLDGALALVDVRELDARELEALAAVLAARPAIRRGTLARLGAELAMRRRDGTDARAIEAYLAAAPSDSRALLYKRLFDAPRPSSGGADRSLWIAWIVLGVSTIGLIIAVFAIRRRRPEPVAMATPVPPPPHTPSIPTLPGGFSVAEPVPVEPEPVPLVPLRIAIEAEVRQGIAVWTTDPDARAYSDAQGDVVLELAPGVHTLHFDSAGEVSTRNVTIGTEKAPRLVVDLRRNSGLVAPADTMMIPEPLPPLTGSEAIPVEVDAEPDEEEEEAPAAPAGKKATSFMAVPPATLSGLPPPPRQPPKPAAPTPPSPPSPVEPGRQTGFELGPAGTTTSPPSDQIGTPTGLVLQPLDVPAMPAAAPTDPATAAPTLTPEPEPEPDADTSTKVSLRISDRDKAFDSQAFAATDVSAKSFDKVIPPPAATPAPTAAPAPTPTPITQVAVEPVETEEIPDRDEPTTVTPVVAEDIGNEPTGIAVASEIVPEIAPDIANEPTGTDLTNDPTAVTKLDEQVTGTVEMTKVGIVPDAPRPPAPIKKPPLQIYRDRTPVPAPKGPLRLGDRYTVLDALPRGGGGTSFRGFDDRLKRQVGVEVHPPVLDPVATAKHVSTLAKLEHPNLVRVYELVVEAGKPYLITEPLEGKSLDQHITDRGVYPWIEAVTLIDSVCAGLEYAHGKSIIHRAIRPGVIVLQVTTAKLGGFAITADRTRPAYLAPEVLAGAKTDPRSDIYALGATLWQALAGKPPTDDRQPIAEIPRKLQILVDSMLAKQPSDRPTSVQALRAGFKSLSDF